MEQPDVQLMLNCTAMKDDQHHDIKAHSRPRQEGGSHRKNPVLVKNGIGWS